MVNKKLKRLSTRSLLFTGLVSLLSGCVSVDPQHLDWSKESVPAQWSSPVALEDVSKVYLNRQSFWSSWNDPELARLMALALERNTDLAQAIASIKESAALLDQKEGAWLPTGDLVGETKRSFAADTHVDQVRAQGALKWSFNLAGAQYFAQQAAKLNVMSSQAAYKSVKERVLAQVADTYVRYRLAQARLTLLSAMIANQKASNALVRARVDAGLDTESERLLSESQLAELVARRPALELEKERAQHALARLTKLPWDRLALEDHEGLPHLESEVALSFPLAVLEQRADVQAAKLKVQAQMNRLSEAKAQFYPSLTLSGSIGSVAGTLSALGTSGTGVGALAGTLNIPILHWSELQAQHRGAQAQLEGSLAQYGKTLVGALEEVENALSAVRLGREKVALQSVTVERLQASESLSEKEFNAGLTEYSRFLMAQRSLQSAQDAYLRFQGEALLNLIELYRATGGSWMPFDMNKTNTTGEQ